MVAKQKLLSDLIGLKGLKAGLTGLKDEAQQQVLE